MLPNLRTKPLKFELWGGRLFVGILGILAVDQEQDFTIYF